MVEPSKKRDNRGGRCGSFEASGKGVSRMFHAAALALGDVSRKCFTAKLEPIAATPSWRTNGKNACARRG
jgi:hypothetical protein